ncbi:hypothetical protein LCGC14_2297190 [marine sediment metagenome]|uniref:Uncharacterized protein n=1 Tax=marine sediment metagenome TaxID=412755 RepID=A0A0F9F216_9ZZZZ
MIEMQEPLCGWPWYSQHKHDYTQDEIDNLSIELRVGDRLQARVQSGKRRDRGIVREIVKLNK